MFCDPEDDDTIQSDGEANPDQIESDEVINNPDGDPVY